MSWITRKRKGEKRSEGGKPEKAASLWTDRGGGTEPSQFWRRENPIKDNLQMADAGPASFTDD